MIRTFNNTTEFTTYGGNDAIRSGEVIYIKSDKSIRFKSNNIDGGDVKNYVATPITASQQQTITEAPAMKTSLEETQASLTEAQQTITDVESTVNDILGE